MNWALMVFLNTFSLFCSSSPDAKEQLVDQDVPLDTPDLQSLKNLPFIDQPLVIPNHSIFHPPGSHVAHSHHFEDHLKFPNGSLMEDDKMEYGSVDYLDWTKEPSEEEKARNPKKQDVFEPMQFSLKAADIKEDNYYTEDFGALDLEDEHPLTKVLPEDILAYGEKLGKHSIHLRRVVNNASPSFNTHSDMDVQELIDEYSEDSDEDINDDVIEEGDDEGIFDEHKEPNVTYPEHTSGMKDDDDDFFLEPRRYTILPYVEYLVEDEVNVTKTEMWSKGNDSTGATCHCGSYKRVYRRNSFNSEIMEEEFPFLVGVIYYQAIQTVLLCGATLITNRFAISAYKCIHDAEVKGIPLALAIRQYDIVRTPDFLIPKAKKIKGEETVEFDNIKTIHYVRVIDVQYIANKIAILRTQTLLKYDWFLEPICFPKSHKINMELKPVEMLGWKTESNRPFDFPFPYYNITMTWLLQEGCKKLFPELTSEDICTKTWLKSQCYGQMGSPVLYYHKSIMRYVLIGIMTNTAEECRRHPGVITSILQWIPLIRKITEGNAIGPGKRLCKVL